jgi:protein-arginine kinase activator protein McsA
MKCVMCKEESTPLFKVKGTEQYVCEDCADRISHGCPRPPGAIACPVVDKENNVLVFGSVWNPDMT